METIGERDKSLRRSVKSLLHVIVTKLQVVHVSEIRWKIAHFKVDPQLSKACKPWMHSRKDHYMQWPMLA